MAVVDQENKSFAVEITKVNMYKFEALKSASLPEPDKNLAIDIRPQAHEITVYESIFSPVIKVDIAMVDYIGLFNNFPLTGNEVIVVEYNSVEGITNKYTLAIESITDPTPSDNNRAVAYIIHCVSIEGLANGLHTIQKGYRGTSAQIIRQILNESINDRIRKFYPSFHSQNEMFEDNETLSSVFVAPNVHPFNAINLVSSLAVSESTEKSMFTFFQNARGFKFSSIQSLVNASTHKASRMKYKYIPMQIGNRKDSDLQDPTKRNPDRLVSSLTFNKRHSAMQKLAVGYFNNNLFEINIAQKAVHSTRTKTEDVTRMNRNGFDTTDYIENAAADIEGEEISNRTTYMTTTRAEDDPDFPILRTRDRWGADIISKAALGQVDITAVIPGTTEFTAGDLFWVEIPEFHAFEDIREDALVSGVFLITEVKHVVTLGGYHSTTLRLNKDSYNTTVDKVSEYV